MEQVDDMEYELLLVNDGSSDDTLEKSQETWCIKKNTRIKHYSFQGILAKQGNLCRIM